MTTEESFAQLEALRNESNPYEMTREEWLSFTQEQKNARYELQLKWKDEQEAKILKAIYAIVPKVGLPCTICYWSDYRAATVSRIISDKKIAVRHNKTNCLDWYGGRYEILPELEEGEDIFTKRKNGAWCMEGQPTKDSVKLMLHYQRHYIDPSF